MNTLNLRARSLSVLIAAAMSVLALSTQADTIHEGGAPISVEKL